MATVFADLATAKSAFAKCWSLGLLTEHDATRGKKTTKTTHGNSLKIGGTGKAGQSKRLNILTLIKFFTDRSIRRFEL